MPKIQWTDLPPALRDHLFERLRERKISAEDLYKLKLWRESEPVAPEGLWYKDFGSFKIYGEGKISQDVPSRRPTRQRQATVTRRAGHARFRLFQIG
jgi:hypothetical protein